MSGELERVKALLGHLDEASYRIKRTGDTRTEQQVIADLIRQSVEPEQLREDLRALVAEVEQGRAERQAWFGGARQRLRHAYRTGWDGHARAILAALAEGGFAAEERAAAYVAEWWDIGARLAAEVEDAVPQQPEPSADADGAR